MLDQVSQLDRKLGKRPNLLGNHPDRDRDMPQQLAFRRITERTIVAQLINLADVVKHNAREQKVEIHAVTHVIMPARQLREASHRKHVLEQAAAESMMNAFR